MPKNKFGGKHKHLSRDIKDKRFEFIEPDNDEVYYAYVGKAYGNRQFDAVIIKNMQKIRLNVPLKRKSKRISENNLIKVSKATCFTKETYCFEGKCEENEINYVEGSEEYCINYKSIKNSYALFTDNSTKGIQFSALDEEDEEENEEKREVSYEEFLGFNENTDSDISDNIDIDDL